MSFSIAAIINRWRAPQRELSCSWLLWRRLTARLRERGRNASRESGAFLLGFREPGGAARIVDFVLYDDLDPHSLDTGIISFDGKYFGKLWAICRERNLTVVADVHVHPGGSDQSQSDRAYPMVSQAGHLALILPNFARAPVPHDDIGIYRYLGGGDWHSVPRAHRRSFFNIGL
jgi:proteasome lid subunit RPN8/RPN11